jgi:hypothetical protein
MEATVHERLGGEGLRFQYLREEQIHGLGHRPEARGRRGRWRNAVQAGRSCGPAADADWERTCGGIGLMEQGQIRICLSQSGNGTTGWWVSCVFTPLPKLLFKSESDLLLPQERKAEEAHRR